MTAREVRSKSARLLAPLAAVALLCAPSLPVAADKRAPLPEDVLPESDLDDPIGVDSEARAVENTARAEQQKRAEKERALPAERARFGPEPPPLDVRKGEVLTAGPSTRELAHLVNITLEPGRASIEVELRFESKAQKPSELRYRLAVPPGSRLAALEVCDAHACRKGLAAARPSTGFDAYDAAVLARSAATDALPIARAYGTRDARGDAIVLQAAPLAESRPLRVKLSYACPVAMHAGVLRLSLPPRGMDPQAAPAEIHLSAPRLIDVRVGDAPASPAGASFDPWLEVALRAQLKRDEPAQANAWQVACGKQRCGVAQLYSGLRAATPFDLVIALDVSPSTEGPARGRLLTAVSALLSAAPEGSRVRALAFAGRARALIEQPLEPSQVVLAPFGKALGEAELGSATRFEAVWQLASAWLKTRKAGLRPLVVIVGDGGLTVGEAKPFERARAAGVEVSSLNAADRATSAALFTRVVQNGGVALDIGPEAEAATRGRATTALDERVLALYTPTVAAHAVVSADGRRLEFGPLRAGELLEWRGATRAGFSLHYGARSLAPRVPGERDPASALAAGALGANGNALLALDRRDLELSVRGDWPEQPRNHCDHRGPAQRASGISSDAAPVALAEERACKPKPKAEVRAGTDPDIGKGMPGDPLLSMLRQRILPVARGCFRRDRAGRADYTTRAVFVFTLAEREVVEARIEGKIADGLRTCLLSAVDALDVPRFSGVVNVRYPLVTESVPLPEQIDLRAATAGKLDRLFGAPEKASNPAP